MTPRRQATLNLSPSLQYDGGDLRAWQRRLCRKLRQLVGEMSKERCALRHHQRVLGGAKGRCHLVVGEGGHRFHADDAWPVMLKEIAGLQRTGKPK